MFSMCDPSEIHCLKSGQPTEETRMLGIHEFIPIAEEIYILDDEPVLTSDNIEHMAD